MLKVFTELLPMLTVKEKREIAALFLIVLCMAIIETLGVASIMPFMALLAKPDLASQSKWINALYINLDFTRIDTFLFFLGVIVLLVFVFTNAFAAFTAWRIQRFVANENHRFAHRLLENYLYRPYAFFLRQNTAELGKNILSESAMLTDGIILPVVHLVAKATVVCCITALLLWVDPVLALVMGGLLGIGYGLIYAIAQRKLGRYGTAKIDANSARYKAAGEALAGLKDIKILGREGYFLDRFSRAACEFSNITANYQLIKQLPRYLLEVLAFGGILIITLYLLLVKKNVSQIIPALGLYVLAGYRLMPALQEIYLSLSTIKFNRAAGELIQRELEEGQISAGSTYDPIGGDFLFEHDISLDHVWFGYEGEERCEPLFRNLNLSIEKNAFVAFVGETGSGKTTIADLIMALHEPQQGHLVVDGKTITLGNAGRWRKKIGYVPQQIYLCDDTVAANIALGLDPSAISPVRLEVAARAANIHKFIKHELPEGYQTVVGERGVRLSGGQRQRIGIARALYNDPEVLVFDEATSALDGITESAVMEAIHSLAGKKTMIVIAHRLTSVMACDMIFVLDKGQLVDQGSFDDLIGRNARFQAMAKSFQENQVQQK